MPTYEYQCKKCGYEFEEFQSMTEQPVRRCPRCKGKVQRLIGSGAGIIFKGSGFYETDYRSHSYQKQAKKEKEKIKGDSPTEVKKTDASKSGKETATAKKESDS
jgi:putative FmdB family regulatory protein